MPEEEKKAVTPQPQQAAETNSAAAPGKFADDPDFLADGARIRVDKKTGNATACDGGKDDDGREDDFFEVEEATGEQFMSVLPWKG